MDKLKGAIYGLAIGDALGLPYEFKERGTFVCDKMTGFGTWNQLPGTFSDDTSLTLATLKSIKDNNKIDLDDIMNNFKKWYFNNSFTSRNKMFDVGYTTSISIITGIPRDDFESNGNGSLMRILPLAFTNATDEQIFDVSGLTHNHYIAKKACLIYINIARKLINNEKLEDILFSLEYEKPFNRLNILNKLNEQQIKSSGYVVDSLEASLWVLLKSKSYKECVLKAINLGGDTDSIAAISGGLAGIIYGYNSIPDEWINKLFNKELIEECLF